MPKQIKSIFWQNFKLSLVRITSICLIVVLLASQKLVIKGKINQQEYLVNTIETFAEITSQISTEDESQTIIENLDKEEEIEPSPQQTDI